MKLPEAFKTSGSSMLLFLKHKIHGKNQQKKCDQVIKPEGLRFKNNSVKTANTTSVITS